MGGKAALIIVVGFGIVLMFYSSNNNSVAGLASENFVDHYVNEVAYRIAVTGANIAANRFFVSPAWKPSTEGLDDADFSGGTLRITRYDTAAYNGRVTVVSEGSYFGTTRRVTVVMQATSFGKFVLYVNDFGTSGHYPGGTVFDGPVHINVPFKSGVPDPARALRLDGSPTFKGKVTSDIMWKSATSTPATPKFEQGFESGVHISLPDQFAEQLKNACDVGSYSKSGTHQVGVKFNADRNVSIVFNSNGTITYKEFALSDTSFNTKGKRCDPPSDPAVAAAQGWITTRFEDMVPAGEEFNGAVMVPNGNVRIKGTIDGNITLGVLDKDNKVAPTLTTSSNPFSVSPNSYRGNVWFEDDVLYKDDPLTNPASDDMFGIVCTNYLFAANTEANNKTDLITCGSYFSRFKGAITENLWTLPDMVFGGQRLDWIYRGGWTEGQAQYTTYGSKKGYDQIYQYDPRLQKQSPPFFPATGALSILSWYEE